jgi:lysozyme
MSVIDIPDLSHYNVGTPLDGVPFAWFKATEGTSFLDPTYTDYTRRAEVAGIPYGAYHFLTVANALGQARMAFFTVGPHVPLFVDVERGSFGASRPNLAQVMAFINAYRALGGMCHLAYLPREYWRDVLNSPDLRPLSTMDVHLTNAQYTRYSDTGPGWEAYGGVIPQCWQYTSRGVLNGRSVDLNAYRGTLNQFIAMVTGGRGMQAAVESSPQHIENMVGNMFSEFRTTLGSVNTKLDALSTRLVDVEATLAKLAAAEAAEAPVPPAAS